MTTAQPQILPRSSDLAAHSAATRARLNVVAAMLVLGSALVIAVLLWHPGPARDDISYAAFAAVRDATWLGTVLDVIGYVAAASALGIAVCALVPTRGAALATIGAVFASIGGAVFAVGFYGLVSLGWYATEPDAIPVEAGTSLMSYVADNLGRVAGLEMVGFLLLNIGIVVLAAALLRGGSGPRWLPILMIVLTLMQFVVPASRALDFVQAALIATFIVIAWLLRNLTKRLATELS